MRVGRVIPLAGLTRAHECTHELAVHLRRECVHIQTLFREKFSRVFNAVDTGRFDFDLLETRRGQLAAIFVFVERARYAADPQQHALANLWRAISPRVTTSDTANRPPGFKTRKASRSTWSLSAERLMTQFEMITSTELSGSGMCSISPFRNSTFSAPDFALVLVREREHFVRHVEAIGFACGTNALGRKQYVNAATGAQDRAQSLRRSISPKRSDFRTRAKPAAPRSGICSACGCVIEIRRNRIACAIACRSGSAAATAAAPDPQGRLPVFFFDRFSDVRIVQVVASYLQICMMACGRTALFRVQHSA